MRTWICVFVVRPDCLRFLTFEQYIQYSICSAFQRGQISLNKYSGHTFKMTGDDPPVDFISRLYHLAQAEKLSPQFV